ncbi:serine carboxypeptidase-like 15 [Brassica rapa]|uniref:serine carboxypeptidase-like 15 n=1 Tax=Brassica campestris TaxID=3711 RepID=UPI00142D97C0|nr:serine carboxypeptidase-like 15 [Brassica rapa]
MGSWILKLLLPIILLVLIKHADAYSIIKYLPGFEGPLPFELETGCSSMSFILFSISVPLYIGVGEWLDKHPEYFSNPFYVAGNSYSGKVIPAIVQEISNGNGICCKPQIYLQGYLLGNPTTNVDHDRNSRIPLAHGMSMKKSCRGNYFNTDPQNTECLKLVEDFNRSVSKIYEELILESNCDATSPDCYTYRYTLSEYCANKESVSRALRVKGTTARWERCNYNVQCNKNIKSSIPHIEGYRSLIFGYTKTYANKMTFATMKGGGHTLEYKPVESSILFERWISGQPL